MFVENFNPTEKETQSTKLTQPLLVLLIMCMV